MFLVVLATTAFFPIGEIPDSWRYSKNTQNDMSQYWHCVIAKSVSLERSKEPVDAVADAAMTACAGERMNLHADMALDAVAAAADTARAAVDGKPLPEPTPDGEMALRQFDERLRDQARLRLIEIRAARGHE